MSRRLGFAGPPQVRGGRKQRLEEVPLGVGQVAGIGFGSHPLSTYESALWNRLLESVPEVRFWRAGGVSPIPVNLRRNSFGTIELVGTSGTKGGSHDDYLRQSR